jgi:hypothetical protein
LEAARAPPALASPASPLPPTCPFHCAHAPPPPPPPPPKRRTHVGHAGRAHAAARRRLAHADELGLHGGVEPRDLGGGAVWSVPEGGEGRGCRGQDGGTARLGRRERLRAEGRGWNRNRNSDALGRELREAPLTRLWGHILAATHRKRGPLFPPFTTRVAEGVSACSMVFHGVFRPASLERCARPTKLGNRPVCLRL